MTAMDEMRLLTVSQAAQRLQVSVSTVRRLIRSGELPAVRIRRRVLISVHDVDEFVAKSRTCLPNPG